ncbi:MAG: FAD binding domain-containing protein [bacterium]
MNKFEYALPDKLSDVFGYLKHPNASIKAGGIDQLDLMKEGIATPARLVNIRNLKELHFIKSDSKRGLIIGPNVTLGELAEDNNLKGAYRALAQAAHGTATPQIRNSATLGGNICQRPRCWYFRSSDFNCSRKGGETCFAIEGENQYHAIFGNQDGCVIVHPSATAVALMALDAKLKIVSEKSEHEIAIDKFFVAPAEDITRENVLKAGEMISEIVLPPAPEGFISFYFKQKEKQAFDWPLAEVAVALTMKDGKCRNARIVLGAAAPIPWRVPAAEKLLVGQAISVELARKAGNEAVKTANPLSLNTYKIAVFKAVVYRAICWATGIDPFA